MVSLASSYLSSVQRFLSQRTLSLPGSGRTARGMPLLQGWADSEGSLHRVLRHRPGPALVIGWSRDTSVTSGENWMPSQLYVGVN